MTLTWHGVIPAVTTQFKSDQSLDVSATLTHIDALLAGGVHGLVMLGTVGENCSLENTEKAELLARTVRHVGGRAPVISGVAEYTTAQACRAAKMAADAGVDGLMVLPAMVYKSDHRETMAHFRSVAAATDRPILVYNNPVTYGVDIRPEAFMELADLAAVEAIKESSENPRRITDIYNTCGTRFKLLCGVDDLVLESHALGACGWISGLVNAFPRESCYFWKLLESGELRKARDIYRWYTPLLHLDTHVKLVQYIKLVSAECGYGTEMVRLPRMPLVGEERGRIIDLVRRAIADRPQLPHA